MKRIVNEGALVSLLLTLSSIVIDGYAGINPSITYISKYFIFYIIFPAIPLCVCIFFYRLRIRFLSFSSCIIAILICLFIIWFSSARYFFNRENSNLSFYYGGDIFIDGMITDYGLTYFSISLLCYGASLITFLYVTLAPRNERGE